MCDLGVRTQCAHMQNGQKGKNRPTESIKMCEREVEINSNSCKFESSDLEIGCGCRKMFYFELNNLTCSTWGNMHNVHTCKLATNVKNRPTKSIKLCGRDVETNSNSCKFESSDLEKGCGCKEIFFSN